ncbi:MAG TPA: hypothetical protein VNK50_13615 [Calidithermus sp.]|nr:hypothetical protein [Calidithermus sp.]
MDDTTLRELTEQGRMRWSEARRAWLAEPEDVVGALGRQGFEECKREAARLGGVWQGLNTRTGAVASAVWVRASEGSLVFIDIDGRVVQGHDGG